MGGGGKSPKTRDESEPSELNFETRRRETIQAHHLLLLVPDISLYGRKLQVVARSECERSPSEGFGKSGEELSFLKGRGGRGSEVEGREESKGGDRRRPGRGRKEGTEAINRERRTGEDVLFTALSVRGWWFEGNSRSELTLLSSGWPSCSSLSFFFSSWKKKDLQGGPPQRFFFFSFGQKRMPSHTLAIKRVFSNNLSCAISP